MKDTTNISHTIEAEVLFNKFSHDFTELYEINQSTEWVNGILGELHEQLDKDDEYPAGSLTINLEVTRKKNNILGDHLIVKAHIDAHYHLPCGLTLKPLAQHMDIEVAGAFLHDSMEKYPEYAEATTVFADGQEIELYFYRKGKVDIKEFIHEQIFLEVPAFPRYTDAEQTDIVEE